MEHGWSSSRPTARTSTLAVPAPERQPTRMSRWLVVDRTLCSRMVLAARSTGGPMEMFSRLPGVEGLLLIVHALASRGVDASRVAAARLAVQEYADLVGTAGGSQAKLIRAMQARAESPGGDPEAACRLAFRRRIFEGAAGITGAWSDTLLMISAYRPSPRADGQLERLAEFANLGLRRRAGAFPLSQRST